MTQSYSLNLVSNFFPKLQPTGHHQSKSNIRNFFFNFKDRITDRRTDRRERECVSSICWFTPRMALIVGQDQQPQAASGHIPSRGPLGPSSPSFPGTFAANRVGSRILVFETCVHTGCWCSQGPSVRILDFQASPQLHFMVVPSVFLTAKVS